MDRGGLNNPQDIKKMSEQLDKYNYYSMLLTYHSKNSDLLIKSLLAADKNINLKFMLAIRTYAISPEYLSMICDSYNQSFPNKLILNITSGDIHSEENSINDIPIFNEYLNTPEKRLDYTEEWTKKFIEICSNKYLPELFMAGHSNKTREMANKFNATHISMLDMHIKYLKENASINKKQLISLSILIKDNINEAKEFLLKNNTTILVAEYEDVFLGMASISFNEDMALFGNLYVGLQERGIGSLLTKHRFALVQSHVSLTAPGSSYGVQARCFYQNHRAYKHLLKHGFAPINWKLHKTYSFPIVIMEQTLYNHQPTYIQSGF